MASQDDLDQGQGRHVDTDWECARLHGFGVEGIQEDWNWWTAKDIDILCSLNDGRLLGDGIRSTSQPIP